MKVSKIAEKCCPYLTRAEAATRIFWTEKDNRYSRGIVPLEFSMGCAIMNIRNSYGEMNNVYKEAYI